MQRRKLVGLIGLVIAGCAAPEPAAPPVDVVAEAQAVRDASMAWLAAVQARDFAAAAANFAPDGYSFPEHRDPLMGPAAIQADFEAQWAKTPSATLSWTVDNVVVAASGDLAMELGSFTFTDAGEEDRGKYITVWRKVDGAWKVAGDMGVSIVPEKADSM